MWVTEFLDDGEFVFCVVGLTLGWLNSRDSLSEQGKWLDYVIQVSFCLLFVDTLTAF